MVGRKAIFLPTSTKDNDLQQKPTNQNPEVKIHSTVLAKWVDARPFKTYIDMGAWGGSSCFAGNPFQVMASIELLSKNNPNFESQSRH